MKTPETEQQSTWRTEINGQEGTRTEKENAREGESSEGDTARRSYQCSQPTHCRSRFGGASAAGTRSRRQLLQDTAGASSRNLRDTFGRRPATQSTGEQAGNSTWKHVTLTNPPCKQQLKLTKRNVCHPSVRDASSVPRALLPCASTHQAT